MSKHKGVTTKQRVLAALRAGEPGITLARGWHKYGKTLNRFGWAAKYPTGEVTYLGPTIEMAARKLGLGQAT